jgi:hypothetical protein
MDEARRTELTVLLKRSQQHDSASRCTVYTGYEVCWPDGRAMDVAAQRFCQHGTRLLVGRRHQPQTALVKLCIHPIDGLEAPLTRPGPGIRCRRFYTLWKENLIRLHFFTGTATELVADPTRDDRALLLWLQVERMRSGVPFWFDMTSQLIAQA